MLTFTIHGSYGFLEGRAPPPQYRIQGFLSAIVKGGHLSVIVFFDLLQRGDTDTAHAGDHPDW